MPDWSSFESALSQAWAEASRKKASLLIVSGESPLSALEPISRISQSAFFYQDMTSEARFSPWSPLLPLAERFWSGKTPPPELTPVLNRPLFQAVFSRSAFSWVPPILESIPYEKAGLVRDLLTLIRHGTSTPLALVVANSQALSSEVLEALLSLADPTEESSPIAVILHFNEKKVRRLAEEDDFVQGFFWEKAYMGEVFFHSSPEGEPPSVWSMSPQELLTTLEACRNFLSLRQGLELGEKAQEPAFYRQFSESERYRFQTLLGALHLFQEEWDEAFLQLDRPPGESTGSWEVWERTYLLALTLHKRGHRESSVRLLEQGLDQARSIHDRHWEALFLFLRHDIVRRYDREHFQDQEAYRKLLFILEEQDLPIQRISVLVNHPFEYSSTTQMERHFGPIEEGLALAKSLNHDFSLSTAYHRMGIHVAALEGERKALAFYFEAAEVRKKLKQALPLVRINNGISHSYLNQGDFSSAMEYLEENFKLLEKTQDYGELIITLFNLGQVYFFGREFRQAKEAYLKVLQFMPLLGLNHIPFNSHEDILLHLAYCKLELGETLSAKGILESLQSRPMMLNLHSLALFHLAQMARTVLEKEGWKVVEEHYRRALENVPVNKTFETRSLVFLHHEGAHWMKKGGFIWKAKEIWEQAQKMVRTRDLLLFSRWFDHPWEVHREWRFPFTGLATSLGALESLVKQERNLISLHKRLREIQFLNNSLEIFQSSRTKETFADRLVEHVMGFIPSQAVQFWEYRSGKWDLLDKKGDWRNFEQTELDWLAVQFSLSAGSIGVPEDLKKAGDFLGFPLKNSGTLLGLLVLIAKPGQVYSIHVSNIMNIMGSYISAHLVNIIREGELLHFSQTDGLTGLGNRKALQDQLEREGKRLQRIRMSAGRAQFTVAFIDLDHFKHYNDSFGHQAGDFILVWFSKMLTEHFFASDLIFRYGGDEFVILMPETSPEGAVQAAKKLLTAFKQKNYFFSELSQVLGILPEVDPSKRLSCSIGLASLDPAAGKDDVGELLQQADTALYKAKREGKNRYASWPI